MSQQVLDRGTHDKVPVIDGIFVDRNLQARSRFMDGLRNVTSRLRSNNQMTDLNQARRSQQWFAIGLATQDHTETGPRQSGWKRSNVSIEKQKSKSAIGNQLVGFEVCSCLIDGAQNNT